MSKIYYRGTVLPKIAIISCETTGFRSGDEIVALAAIICDVSDKGKVENLIEWYGEQEPRARVHEKTFKSSHGRTLKHFLGKSMNLGVLEGLLTDVDIMISHNARFESKMLSKLIPDVLEKGWRCSYRQWPWHTMANGRLKTVCAFFKIERPENPTAMDDAVALFDALLRPGSRSDKRDTYLQRLIKKDAFEFDGKRKGSKNTSDNTSSRGVSHKIPQFLPPSIQSLLKKILRHKTENEYSKKKK